MATKTFSSRVDADALALADAVARRDYGLSYGQYCGTILLETVGHTGRMPDLEADRAPSEEKKRAVSFIKGFASRARHPEIASLSDEEVRELIASRYE